MSGALPGGTIIEERALTEELGLSRTPLREALGRLEGEGYLVRQGRKLVVHTITERDFIEILHMRKILEGEAVALATPRLSLDQIQILRTALASLEPPAHPSGSDRRSVDDLLHSTIAENSGNRRLAAAIDDLRQKTRPIGVRLLNEISYPILDFNEHMAILYAIEMRNPEQARLAMLAHLESARTNILRKLAEY
jgi:DNA-binding GntR family transcriptional regulator